MANIKSIQIEGFQSHQYSELHFEDGLNVIIGASDQGKSAVIRALRWVLFNEPRGADFIRVGESLSRVAVMLDNNVTIIRERNQSGSKNRYVLKTPGEEEQIFEGFSHQGVPEEILQAHGMRKIALDEDHERVLNVGQQLEGAFLLSENGALKAKAIGRIAGIHILDFAGRTVIKDLNRITSERRRTEEDLQNVRLSLQQYDDLPELMKRLDSMTLLAQGIEKSEDRLTTLQLWQEKLERIHREKAQMKEIMTKLKDIDQFNYTIVQLEENARKVERIQRLHHKWSITQQGIDKAKYFLDNCASLVEVERIVPSLTIYDKELQQLLRVHNRFNEAIKHQNNSEQLLQQTTGVEKTGQLLQKVESLRERGSVLSQLRTRTLQARDRMNRYEKGIEQLSGVNEAEEKTNRIEQLPTAILKLQSLKNKFDQLKQFLEQSKLERDQSTRAIVTLLTEYEEALQHAGKCPTCYSHINDTVIDQIINEYIQGGKIDERELRRAN